jgi:CubicO group peptidase (beta-lactamase class C family)
MLNSRRFPKTCAVMESGLQERVAPGFVAGIWQKKFPEKVNLGAWGFRRVDSLDLPALPMLPETVFDLASLTKIIGTAALAAVLVDRQWLSWATPVAALLPGYRFPEVKIQHLLSHTAGYVAWKPFWKGILERALLLQNLGEAPVEASSEVLMGASAASLLKASQALRKIHVKIRQEWMKEMVLAEAPDAAPGTRMLYSDLSFLLLGFALEELVQMPLDDAVKKWVWDPMQMSDTYFSRIPSGLGTAKNVRNEQVAATENCPWRKVILQGEVHDDNCWAMGGYAGHAGAFGTALDLLRFSQRLMTGFFNPSVLQALWTRVSMPSGCTRTLGWDTPSGDNSAVGRYFSSASVGHLGFTGTSLWIDPQAGIAVTLLSNRIHPSRVNEKIRTFRPKFHEAVWQDLRDCP